MRLVAQPPRRPEDRRPGPAMEEDLWRGEVREREPFGRYFAVLRTPFTAKGSRTHSLPRLAVLLEDLRGLLSEQRRGCIVNACADKR